MSSIVGSFRSYARNLHIAINTVSDEDIKNAYNTLTLSLGSPVYIFGNGGSAAIADHFCCDYNKGIIMIQDSRPKQLVFLLMDR